MTFLFWRLFHLDIHGATLNFDTLIDTLWVYGDTLNFDTLTDIRWVYGATLNFDTPVGTH